jgi:hypothetical protein
MDPQQDKEWVRVPGPSMQGLELDTVSPSIVIDIVPRPLLISFTG